MRQIDRIARELKSQLCGKYNHPFRSVTIFLDTDDDELHAGYFEEEEYIKSTASWFTKLVTYESKYGNWGDDYGNEKDWKLTKKRIARDIQDAINEMEDDDDVYIPEWLENEIEYYLDK